MIQYQYFMEYHIAKWLLVSKLDPNVFKILLIIPFGTSQKHSYLIRIPIIPILFFMFFVSGSY